MIIALSGNIASGKSTFMKRLEQKIGNQVVIFLPEKIEEWTSFKMENGKSLFQNYYENPKMYAFKFQTFLAANRTIQLEQAIEKHGRVGIVYVVERTMEDDSKIFSRFLFNNGSMSSDDVKCADYFRLGCNKNYPIYRVFLNVDPIKCFERCKIRSRDEESAIPLDMLQELHKLHFELNFDLILDCNCDLDSKNYVDNVAFLVEKIQIFLINKE